MWPHFEDTHAMAGRRGSEPYGPGERTPECRHLLSALQAASASSQRRTNASDLLQNPPYLRNCVSAIILSPKIYVHPLVTTTFYICSANSNWEDTNHFGIACRTQHHRQREPSNRVCPIFRVSIMLPAYAPTESGVQHICCCY